MRLDKYIAPFPKVVRIEPSSSCNLKCSHCPTGTVQMRRGIMNSDTFSRVLLDIQLNLDSIKVVVLYHGGEPLLNKNLPEMVRQIKDIGVPFVKTVSNGMLLTESMTKNLISSGLDMIEFSLDGENEEENNFIRQNCDYAKVVRNIKRFIEYKSEHKSKTPEIFIATTQFLTKWTLKNKDIEPKVPNYLVQEFSGKYAKEISGFKCTHAMKWPNMEVSEDIYEILDYSENHEISNYCDHIWNTLTVRWNGDIVSCCYDLTSRCVLGNIHKDDLISIWNNKRYLRLRRSIHNMNFHLNCANCNEVKQNIYLSLKSKIASEVLNEEQSNASITEIKLQ